MLRKIMFLILTVFSSQLVAETFDTYQAIGVQFYRPAFPTSCISSATACASDSIVSQMNSAYSWNTYAWSGKYLMETTSSGTTTAIGFNAVRGTCPGGGTLYLGYECQGAPPCVSPQVRSTVTGLCENPPPTCNYTPNVTTVGSTQTIHWETTDTSTTPNTCISHSVSCSSPLIANVEQKRCDLQCDDGTIVNPGAGEQCPPPTCVGEQTLNTVTNQCEDPACNAGGLTNQYLDPYSHTCLNEPYCIGEQSLNTSTVPHVCDDPVCAAPKVLNVTTKVCAVPPPPECTGAQYLNADQTACVDPVCPTGFHLNADKICEFTPQCPEYSTKLMVGGMLKCVTDDTKTDTKTTDDPTVTVTRTQTNPDGTTTTTNESPGYFETTTTNPDGSITTTVTQPGKTSTAECADCAKESTLRDISKKLTATTALGSYTSSANTTDSGNFDTTASLDALTTEKQALADKMSEVKSGLSGLFDGSVTDGTAVLPVIEFGDMKGKHIILDMNKHADQLRVISTLIIAVAWLSALSIVMSR